MILILTIGSKNLGYGHLRRSILLKDKFGKKSKIIKFEENNKIINFSKIN